MNFTPTKAGHQLSQRGGDTSTKDAEGTAPSRGDGCAIKPHVGASGDTGIIDSPELSLSPPLALLGTFRTDQDKGRETKWATGSNPASVQVPHFHTRRQKPNFPSRGSPPRALLVRVMETRARAAAPGAPFGLSAFIGADWLLSSRP